MADIGAVVGVIGKIKPRISNYTSKNQILALEMASDARVVPNARMIGTQGLRISDR